MKLIKYISLFLLVISLRSVAQTVDASPEVSTICFGATANLTATYAGPAVTATTNYTPSTIPYAPDPFSGTNVSLTDDTQTGFLPIGFSFCFYGQTYTQFIIGSNNWIGFSAGQTSTWVTTAIPTNAGTAPMNTIMGAWQDINPGIGGTVSYAVYGTAPNRRLVVSWSNVPMFSCTGQLYSSQIKIYETTNIIETHILNKSLCTTWNSGNAVHGLHDATGTAAVVVPGRNNTQWTANNEGTRFTPSGAASSTVNWYVLPSNTLVGTGTSITVTPPSCQVNTLYYAQVSTTGTCLTGFGTDTVLVTQNNCTPCSATATNNGPVCVGATINLTTPTVAGATYAWSGPNGYTSTLQNPTLPATLAAAGVYTVTVTQTSSCNICTGTTTVVVNPIPAAVTPTNNGPVCSGATLNLTAPAVVGATYSWTGPNIYTSTQQNPTISPTTTANTGTYSVTVTVNGCTSPAGTTSVVVNNTPNPPVPAINGNATPAAICEGGTITLTANNIAGATYAWTGPNGYTAAVRNPPPLTNVTAAAGGTYSLTVTIGGCTSNPATVTIVVNTLPVVPTVSNVTICTGTSATLTATAPGPNYEWYDAATAGNLLASTASYSTPVLSSSATYYVQAVNGTCIGPRTAVTVTVNPGIVANAGIDDTICSGTAINLNVLSPTGAGYNYSWDAPSNIGFSTLANPSVNPTTTTTYTLTVSDGIGCSGTDQVTITVSSPMTLSIAGIDATCAGACNGTATTTFSGGISPYTYAWSNGATTNNLSALCANTYSLTVTDVVGCTVQGVVTIQEPTALVVTHTSTSINCNGVCNGTANVTATGGTGVYTYLWNNGQTIANLTNLCAGTYTCVVTDANNCSASTVVTITEPTALILNAITPVTICIGNSTTLTAIATGGTAPYTYNWLPTFTGQANNVSPTTTTTYSVSVSDANGCNSAQQTVTVTVNPPLAVTLTASTNTICSGASVALTANATGGNGTYTYTWMPGNLSGATVNVSPTANTTYTVTVSDGCTILSATNTTTITVNSIPVVSFNANQLIGCAPINVNFTDLSTVQGSTITAWSWNFGNGGAIVQNPSNAFESAGSYSVTLTVTAANGCTNSATVTNMIQVLAVPQADFVYAPELISITAPTVSFNTTSTNATSWTWNFDDLYASSQANTSNAPNPNYTYSEVGEYCVKLIVSNQNMCFDSIVHCLDIKPDYTFFIPNAFTPNGSGLNDVFKPKGENIVEFTMRIFDRWGNEVFTSTNMNDGWDGRVKGKGQIAQVDVYAYIIEIKDTIGEYHKYIGHVTIVK